MNTCKGMIWHGIQGFSRRTWALKTDGLNHNQDCRVYQRWFELAQNMPISFFTRNIDSLKSLNLGTASGVNFVALSTNFKYYSTIFTSIFQHIILIIDYLS